MSIVSKEQDWFQPIKNIGTSLLHYRTRQIGRASLFMPKAAPTMQNSPIRIQRTKSGIFRERHRIFKRAFDLAVCFLTAPMILAAISTIALLIWIEDRRNPFFVQERIGKGGKPFQMYKFRTMVSNSAAIFEQIKHLNEVQWPAFKMKNDPRITRVGKFLRRTSLDELPQLWNVVKGEMSLVGPRPNSFKPELYHALWQHERLEVLPGMTGLWAVEGRSDLSFNEWVLLDISYISQQSIAFDLNILWRTLESVLWQRGAY